MMICQVVGHVWATKKEEKLNGHKLMIVREETTTTRKGATFVAADSVGAGIGEMVLVVSGSTARRAIGEDDAPIDSAIVGIIDSMRFQRRRINMAGLTEIIKEAVSSDAAERVFRPMQNTPAVRSKTIIVNGAECEPLPADGPVSHEKLRQKADPDGRPDQGRNWCERIYHCVKSGIYKGDRVSGACH